MKFKQFIFTLVVMLSSFVMSANAEEVANVAKIGDQGYATLSAALSAAKAGETITFVADITQDVTVSKSVTIDGADKTYTGKMTLKGDAIIIKNLNFDGKGYNGYAVETRGANYVTIEECTAKNYGYGFVQLASATALTTVKNVTVSDMNYGVKVDYSNAVVLENVDITAAVAAVLNSNYGKKDITIKNSKLSIYGTYTRNNTIETNIVFEGANTIGKFIDEPALDKYVLAVGATLTAPEGKTVATAEGYEVKYENGVYTSVEKSTAVAMIGEEDYETLAAAIAAAQPGQTITFVADITEDVTVSKAVTIDGAGKTYTGAMTLKADATIKNLNFDGKGFNGYAITTRGAQYLTIEDCTAKNYGYGFVQLASGTALTTVKNVTVSNMNYGVKVDYSNAVVLENVDMTAGVAAVLNSNYGEKTITIKDSKLNILGTWTRNNTIKTNYLFKGANTVAEFKTDAAIDNFKLDKEATLAAAEGLTVTTDAAGYMVKYEDGVYKVVGANVKNEATGATYATIAEAISAAQAGQTITLAADITEDVTVNKAVTIDGTGKTYTGAMTLKADVTIKNLNFDGEGYNGYAITTRGAQYLTIEACTAKNYGYGFVQLASGTALTTVKDVTVSNMNYGVKVDYSNAVVLENVDITAAVAAVLNSNYGEKTITIKNSKLNKLGTWTRNNTIKTNYVFDGANAVAEFITDDAIDNFKLAAGATLTAPEGKTVTTVDGYEVEYENGVYTSVEKTYVAKIGEQSYETIAAALAAAQAGQTLTLLADLTMSEILVINKAITLDGNGKTLTSTAARAINVDGADGVTIKNLTINASGERAINVIQNATNVTIDNVTATAANYTVNVAASAPNAVVAINNSTLNGLCTVNVAAAGVQVTIDNSTVNCNDNNTTAGESYAALCLNKAAVGASIIATNTTVNVTEGSDSTKGRNGAENGTVTINGSTEDVNVTVAVITYEGSDYYHGFSSLAEAIEFAKEGDVITLIRDVTMNYGAREAFATNANTVTIDGNGKTLTLNQTNSDWSSFGLANDSKVVLNNMTIKKSGKGATSGAWNTHAIIFSCPVEMNDVTVNNSVAVQAGATLNNVTINEANGYYGLWINGNGQAVTVKGGAINATNGGRGIKIADQYIDEPAQVTLNVNGTVFNTAKKAAVLVSSKAGAQITASNVNITNVAEDKVNFVWVDEDWAQYYGNVTVTGAKVRAESAGSFVATVTVGSAVKGYFKTLAAAVEAAPAGATVTLLDNVTLEGGYAQDPEAGLLIDKAITIKGNGYTVDCGKFTKGIRVYNNSGAKSVVSFYNTTIVNNNAYGRCVDTRSGNIDLLLYTSTLKATGTTSQPLTLGGSERLYRVRIQATTIDAGKSGYGVIAFVPSWAGITASTGSNISGLAAFYLKDGVNGTTLSLDKGTYTGINKYNKNSGVFGTVVVEGDNNTIAVKASNAVVKAVSADGTESAGQAAFLVADGATGNKIQLIGEVATEGSQTYLAMVDANVAATTSFTKGGVAMAYVAECAGYKFFALDEAFRIAENGCTVKLLADVNVDTKNCVTCGGYSSIFNVKGMELTFDLNGHTITVDADPADFANAKSNMLMGVFTVDDDGKLTIDDSSEAKNGAVNVNANGATVYSLAAEYGKDAKLTIKNGSYYVDEMPNATSLIYAQHCEGVIINGGTYNIGNVGTLQNGSPWIFNTKGQNVDGIYVYGGTYPIDINHQFWFNEAIVPANLALKDNGDGTWSVVEAAAYTNEIGRSTGSWRRNVGYATIEEAIAATQTRNCKDNVVTLAKSVELENTITVANGVAVTLNLNGNTISATDNATGSYALITNRGNLTIEGDGAITLTATQNRGWNAFSSVISNTVGGKLTVNGGTIEHLGGTDMAYGIDNLTNGKGTYAETIINDGEIKSTYRAIRMFLNGVEAQNILTVNGGTIEGANKSIWMQDPSKNANTGNLYVGEEAVLNGDVYLTVTAGSTQWPVQAYIEKAALNASGKTVLVSNVPADAAALVEYDTFWQVEQKNLAELTINDACEEYINKIEKNVGELTYKRYFDDTEWQTIVLPFDVTVTADLMEMFDFAYIYNASYKGKQARIDYVEIEEGFVMAANYPYLVKAKSTGWNNIVVVNAKLMPTKAETLECSSIFEKFSFIGNYATVDADDLDVANGYFNLTSGAWSKMETVNPFRFYMQIALRNGDAFEYPADAAGSILMRSVDQNGNATTGVDSVDAEQAGEFIFDLHGRRVAEPEKGGIYIINGQKVLVK